MSSSSSSPLASPSAVAPSPPPGWFRQIAERPPPLSRPADRGAGEDQPPPDPLRPSDPPRRRPLRLPLHPAVVRSGRRPCRSASLESERRGRERIERDREMGGWRVGPHGPTIFYCLCVTDMWVPQFFYLVNAT
ncbi:Os05g0113200 [Oryza sativa Japonica Group]|uniref:Os05g0113200 protein n=2 Tax=Oryza sativa subsp. japonica TaxID=39947 RepID=Q75L15_ORYSJ|nr:unknown protein [Oryza sativa Japonica Group]BAH92907.1 Os05g0113200 [Oryza sativa Japonica Group]|eukprot:NP_001174179.1 Os05g0113200 [Oryza sativa Japonica Group]